MTPEQRKLLEDKIRLWRSSADVGNLEWRDYNRRAADALEAALGATQSPNREAIYDAIMDHCEDATGRSVFGADEATNAILALISTRQPVAFMYEVHDETWLSFDRENPDCIGCDFKETPLYTSPLDAKDDCSE